MIEPATPGTGSLAFRSQLHAYNLAVRFLIKHFDLQIGERYYVIPFPTLAGFVVAVIVVVVIWYAIRKLMYS